MGMPVMDSSKNIEIASAVSPTPQTYHHVVVQQSVTMLAYMDRSNRNETDSSSSSGYSNEPRILLGFSIHDLPILIGAAAGAVGLTVIILVAVIVWHCCRASQNREKAYSVETLERGVGKQMQPTTVVHSPPPPPVAPVAAAPEADNSGGLSPNDMVVFVGGKLSQLYETQLIEKNGIRRTQSLSFNDQGKPVVRVKNSGKSTARPSSQPLALDNQQSGRQNNSEGDIFGLPSIPESDFNRNVPQISQCASYSALDEPSNFKYMLMVDPGANLKTHSLPNWVRNRPLSTEDDLNELYAKVNFSKKRKNRMGNDSAAAIAMNKNCAAFLATPTFANKDTDSLVENEAVVVYDERTSL